MKKKFRKFGEIAFVIGFIALAIMVAFPFIDTDGEIEMPGIVLLFCMLGNLLLLLSVLISAIIAIVEGIREKNLGLLKKIVVQFVVFMVLYTGASFFIESYSGNIGELILRSALISIGIVGVEYIFETPKEEDELHF